MFNDQTIMSIDSYRNVALELLIKAIKSKKKKNCYEL